MAIKNIIFDLGGVIYDVRYENIADEFRKFGIVNFESFYTQAAQSDFIDLYEEGKISSAELRNKIRELSGLPLTGEQIDHAWNAILIDIPKHRVELLGLLKLKYKTYLFSNTNEINLQNFRPKMEQKFGFDIFSVLFNEAFFSSEMGMRKPHVDSFQAILSKHSMNPQETLFIDDSPQHIEGARKAGLQAFHLEKGMELSSLFDEKLDIKDFVLAK